MPGDDGRFGPPRAESTAAPTSPRSHDDGDARATSSICRRTVRGTTIHRCSPAQVAARAPLNIVPDNQNAHHRTAGTVVVKTAGRVADSTDLGTRGHIGMPCVDPDVTRTGMASALLSRMLRTIQELRLAEPTIDASIPATPLFRRHGLVVTEERHPVRGEVQVTKLPHAVPNFQPKGG